MWRALLALCVRWRWPAPLRRKATTRGIDPNQGLSLVEVDVAKAAAMRLQLEAESYGVEFNDHYLRSNPDGSFTVTVFGDEDGLAELHAAGYDLGVTIEGPDTWRARVAERQRKSSRLEDRADLAALDEGVGVQSHEDEIVVLRVDYFENYAGRFLSVEVKDRLGSATPTGSTYVGPALSSPGTRSWNADRLHAADDERQHRPGHLAGHLHRAPRAGPHRRCGRLAGRADTDPDRLEHRSDGRGGRGRLAGRRSSSDDARLHEGLHDSLPGSDGGLRALPQLQAEFPNISELIALPYATNGYQRRAQATMAGTTMPGNSLVGATAQSQAVVLTSRAWGHEGGNDITAEFRNPGVPSLPLSVTVSGKDILVNLATDAAERCPAQSQVVSAINGDPVASTLVVALTYRGNAGAGIVQPPGKGQPVGLPVDADERPPFPAGRSSTS